MDTLRNLIDALEGFAADYGDDIPPRITTAMGLKAPMEYPIQDVDVVEVDKTAEPGETPRHVLYLVAENVGDALAFEARRVFRG